jgi:hypothetical protein
MSLKKSHPPIKKLLVLSFPAAPTFFHFTLFLFSNLERALQATAI